MGGTVSCLVWIIAALIFWFSGSMVLLCLSIGGLVIAFWSFGIMHNHATEAAKNREDYTGGFFDLTAEDAMAVPDWISGVNIITTLLGLVFLVLGLIMWIFW